MALPRIPPSIDVSRVRTSQPQDAGGSRIDWSNPITRGLAFAANGSTGTDSVSGARAVLSGASTKVVGVSGVAHKSPSTQIPGAFTYSVNIPSSFDCTVLVVFRNITANPASTGVPTINFNSTESVYFSSTGSQSIFSSTNNPSTTITTLSAGKLYVIGGVKRINSQEQYVDGALVTTNVTGNRAIGAITQVSIGRPSGLNNIENAEYYGVLYFNRALSVGEIKSLSDNLWQIFAKQSVHSPMLLAPQQPVTPAQSRMLGTSTGAPATAAVVGIGRGKAARASQPQGAVGIDWGNPITRGLVDAIHAADLRTTVAGIAATTSGTMSSGLGILGRKRSSPSSGANKDIYGGAWSRLPAPLTLLTVYKLNTLDFSTRVSGNVTTSTDGYGLAPNITNYRAIVSRSGVNTILVGNATSTTKLKTDLLVIDATNAAFWENGVRTVAPTAHGGMATATGSFTHGAENGASNTTNADYYLSILWNRALTDSEAKSLSDNPYQIFAPSNAPIWGPA